MKLKGVRAMIKGVDVLWGYAFWCVACDSCHIYVVPHPGSEGPTWAFNGDVAKPTFTPSLLLYHAEHNDKGEEISRRTVCHLFVISGQIVYCGDCPHEWRGKTVDMVDIRHGYMINDEVCRACTRWSMWGMIRQ